MIRKLMVAASLCAALHVSLPTAAGATDLTVTVIGVRTAAGSVVGGVFNSAASFPRPGQALASFRIKAAPGDVSITFHNLPPGKYAAVSYHDENDNGALDADPTGAPSEGYGVSNDARRGDGPPHFAEAAFDVAGANTRVSVKLAY
jgi:uncharacterized protein (DUF2141 family)